MCAFVCLFNYRLDVVWKVFIRIARRPEYLRPLDFVKDGLLAFKKQFHAFLQIGLTSFKPGYACFDARE